MKLAGSGLLRWGRDRAWRREVQRGRRELVERELALHLLACRQCWLYGWQDCAAAQALFRRAGAADPKLVDEAAELVRVEQRRLAVGSDR